MAIVDGLLIATGFTGALTLVWLARLALSWFAPTREVRAFLSPENGCVEIVLQLIAAARREVILRSGDFASRPVAQALVDAKLRGVNVEVILDSWNETDPRSELRFLANQGLIPLLDSHDGSSGKLLICDRKTILTGTFLLCAVEETDGVGTALLLRHHPDLAATYCQDLASHREHWTPFSPPPVLVDSTPPIQAESPPEIPIPPKEIKLAEVSLPNPLPPVDPDPVIPRMTAAASEVFARLRKQMADAADDQARAA